MMEDFQGGTDKQLILGIPVIDIQHANLRRMLDNLSSLKVTENINPRFLLAVRETSDYLKYHFDTQEKLMLLLEYPEYIMHKREHEDFFQEILRRSGLFQTGQNADQEEFTCFLKDWINFHAGNSDTAFTDFFVSMRYHSKFRLALCN